MFRCYIYIYIFFKWTILTQNSSLSLSLYSSLCLSLTQNSKSALLSISFSLYCVSIIFTVHSEVPYPSPLLAWPSVRCLLFFTPPPSSSSTASLALLPSQTAFETPHSSIGICCFCHSLHKCFLFPSFLYLRDPQEKYP